MHALLYRGTAPLAAHSSFPTASVSAVMTSAYSACGAAAGRCKPHRTRKQVELLAVQQGLVPRLTVGHSPLFFCRLLLLCAPQGCSCFSMLLRSTPSYCCLQGWLLSLPRQSWKRFRFLRRLSIQGLTVAFSLPWPPLSSALPRRSIPQPGGASELMSIALAPLPSGCP